MSDSTNTPGPEIIPIAGGKGGVGKSAYIVNLGVALAQRELSVILVDLDLGGSNLHSMLGVENKRKGIGSYILREAGSLDELLTPTDYGNLQLISGDAALPGSANIPWWFKRKILNELFSLDADVVLVDLGAGTSYNTLDFFLASETGILISNPEPTSLTNAYSFIKNAYYRRLFRMFPARSKERIFLRDWAQQPGEAIARESLGDAFSRAFPESAETLNGLEHWRLRLVMNDVHSEREAESWKSMAAAVKKFLSSDLELLASIDTDPSLRTSIFRRAPLMSLNPESPFCLGVRRSADALRLQQRDSGEQVLSAARPEIELVI